MTSKVCSICGVERPLEVFENDKRRPDGKGPRCKDCIKARIAARKGAAPPAKPAKSDSSIKGEVSNVKIDTKKPKSQKFESVKTSENAVLKENPDFTPKFHEPRAGTDDCECGHPSRKHYLGQQKACSIQGCPCRHYLLKPELRGNVANRCECGEILSNHTGDKLTCEKTNCGGYVRKFVP